MSTIPVNTSLEAKQCGIKGAKTYKYKEQRVYKNCGLYLCTCKYTQKGWNKQRQVLLKSQGKSSLKQGQKARKGLHAHAPKFPEASEFGYCCKSIK